jgi:AraC-like DNA-binding protein
LKIASPSVPARYFALLCEILDSIGVHTADVLKVAHIDRNLINQPNQTVTLYQVEVCLAEAQRVSGRDDLGFELGRKIRINSHDILGFALLSCATLDHLLRLCSRYYRLMTPTFTLSYQRSDDNAELIFRPSISVTPPTLKFYLEAIAVSAHLLMKSMLQGRPSKYDIYMSMEAPPHVARYKDLGLAKFHFAPTPLPEIRFQINDAHLDTPLPMANPQAVSLAEERCKILLQDSSEQGSWSDWVGMMLRQAEDYQPTLEDLAKILNITSRTLDRHLVKESTSFRELAVRIRNQRACQLLDEGKLAVSQIAYRLGYSDLANFSRSFKKVNGISPSEYKEEHQGKLGNHPA